MSEIGEWTALNDVDVNEVDGQMYYAIFEYILDQFSDSDTRVRRLTDYDLTNEEAWAVVWSHNDLYGFEDA